jgi:hypothetical protein
VADEALPLRRRQSTIGVHPQSRPKPNSHEAHHQRCSPSHLNVVGLRDIMRLSDTARAQGDDAGRDDATSFSRD